MFYFKAEIGMTFVNNKQYINSNNQQFKILITNKEPMKTLFLLPIYLFVLTINSFSQRSNYHKLDSTVVISNDFGNWSTHNKTEYEYDNLGRMIFNNHYFFDHAINDIKPGIKSYYTYDNLNRFSEVVQYNWNTDSLDFILYRKMVYNYGSNQLVSTLVQYEWNSLSSIWSEINKNTYTYDNMNSLVLDKRQWWDLTIPAWKDHQKTEYTYNSNNNLLDKMFFSWYLNNWDSTQKEVYSYTSNNLVDSVIFYGKDFNTGNLKPNLRRGFIYDVQERIIDQTDFMWDITQSIWYIFDRATYQYNNDNDISEKMRYQGDFTIPWRKKVPTYNSQILEADLKLPPNISFHKMKTGTDGQVYWLSDSAWHSNYTETLYYSDVIISTLDLEISNEVKVYPNPTSNFISFKIGNQSKDLSLLIISMNGTVVVNKRITINQMVSLNKLVNGQYVYQLFDGEKHYSGTIMKN
jgi:hypothetical protein